MTPACRFPLTILLLLSLDAPAHAVTFQVSIDPALGDIPIEHGRLVVYAVREKLLRIGQQDPTESVFYSAPRPLYGVDLHDLRTGTTVKIEDSASWFLHKPSQLPAGKYLAAAVLDVHRSDSEWRREPGNLFSTTVPFEVTSGEPGQPVRIVLNKCVEPERDPVLDRVDVVRIRSKLLSDFHQRDVILSAGVVRPENFDPANRYPAIYEVPGFGGNYRDAFSIARPSGRRLRNLDASRRELARSAVWIVLDPESPNGHTLFCDSDVNGPWGRALVEELIPAIEARHPLLAQPSARLLRGHSSGGWSTLWLATEYPDVFGATWSSAPDPVSFHRFESVDLYESDNFFFAAGRPMPSYRRGNKIILNIFEENGMEEVVGPDNTSAQQWDSWMSCWGTRNEHGNATALFDPQSGKIDRAEAERYRRFDITERLKRDPQKYGPIFSQRVRLICGGADNFYLNEAVEILQAEVGKLEIPDSPAGRHGYIKVVPGADHGSVYLSKEMRAIPAEMLDHLRRSGHVP